ncbi:Rpn family recombination-promoting nuclease/putative transposase [Novipirellula sp.]|uniref:Rpn family recombination-promoting nuclease/putative transposase n=1 Tax=Novipirellula sp. TaxID=2795430 RepID=UPI0035685D74
MRDFAVITEMEILSPNIEKRFATDKYSICDVRARDAEGRLFDIEIQRSRTSNLAERLTYYVATQLVEQIGEGDRYSDLRSSIGICNLDAVLFGDIPDLHRDFRLLNERHSLTLTDRLQVHLLELPKSTPPSDNGEITAPIELWCFLFRQAGDLTAEEISHRLPNAAIAEAT